MSRMKIYDMQVNHLSNPLGFRMERTVFSWKVTGSEGKKQTAASIQIATDSNMKNLLADTGFQASADNHEIRAYFENCCVKQSAWLHLGIRKALFKQFGKTFSHVDSIVGKDLGSAALGWLLRTNFPVHRLGVAATALRVAG